MGMTNQNEVKMDKEKIAPSQNFSQILSQRFAETNKENVPLKSQLIAGLSQSALDIKSQLVKSQFEPPREEVGLN